MFIKPLWIYNKAIDMNLETTLVLEDDAEFSDDFLMI